VEKLNAIDINSDLKYSQYKFYIRRIKRMGASTLRVGRLMMPVILMMITWMAVPGDAYGAALYKYTDKDGSIILTDNPPPGVEAKEYLSSDDIPIETKAAPDVEPGVKTQSIPDAEAKKQDKRSKIETLRQEVDKAVSEEAAHRRNMNQSSGYAQRNYWRKLVDEKLKEIEEKKKQIEDLESSR
jgi:hypothetical protein